MQRDRNLIPLSRQHHNGLALCVLTRRSLGADTSAGNVARLAQRAIDRYEIELAGHFAIEEEVLFPLCGDLPLVRELIAEHRELETLIGRLRERPSAETLERFCALLSSHIRREETDLFQQVPHLLTHDALEDAGREIGRRAVQVCL